LAELVACHLVISKFKEGSTIELFGPLLSRSSSSAVKFNRRVNNAVVSTNKYAVKRIVYPDHHNKTMGGYRAVQGL
jgi:hypothetical protein